MQGELTKSFAGAAEVAKQYPEYASGIISAAKTSFLRGDEAAYIAGIVAIVVGAILVFFFFPRREREQALLADYATES